MLDNVSFLIAITRKQYGHADLPWLWPHRAWIIVCALCLLQVACLGPAGEETFRMILESKPECDAPCWRGVTPGVSSERDVRRILGRPADTERLQLFGDELKLSYEGAYTAHPIVIITDTKTDRVLSIRVPRSADTSLEHRTLEFFADHGEPEMIVGGYFPQHGVVTYLYAQKGIVLSVFFHSDDPTLRGIVQFEYFEPMPTQNWLETWGELYNVGPELDLDPG